jgi:hypothetical protein
MAQANYVSNAIRALITGASAKPSTNSVRSAHAEFVTAVAKYLPWPIPLIAETTDLEDRADHLNTALNALLVHVAAVLDDVAQNVPGTLDLRQIEALLSEPHVRRDWHHPARSRRYGREGRMSPRSKPADRRYFIGGSDTRIIIDDSPVALVRLWPVQAAHASFVAARGLEPSRPVPAPPTLSTAAST